MGMLQEFKEFAMKGNLVDLAVGVVMGAAFGAVTNAFINGIFMPLVGLIFNVGDMSQAKLVLSPAVTDAAGKVITPESAVMYGSFVGAIINFLIVAFVMFMVIKAMNKMKKEQPVADPGPSSTDALLMEIRDALKK